MPIAVACTCGVKLKAPDAAAGKRVKCPKCGAGLLVPVPAPEPDFEFVDDEPGPTPVAAAKPVAKPKPQLIEDDEDEPRPAKRKPRLLDDADDEKPAKKKAKPVEVDEAVDDDEDEKPKKKSRRDRDEEEEAPKKKSRRDRDEENDEKPAKKSRRSRDEEDDAPKKKGKGKKSNLPLILGIGGGVLVLAVVGIVVGVMLSGNNDQTKGTNTGPGGTPGGGQTGLPSGWSKFQGEGFSVAVPDSAKFGSQPGVPAQQGKAWGTTGLNGPPSPGQVVYIVSISQLPKESQQMLDQDPSLVGTLMKLGLSKGADQFGKGMKVESDKKVPLDGGDGIQFTLKGPEAGGHLRFCYRKGKLITWGVMAQAVPDDNEQSVKTFFDTFLLEGTGPTTTPPPANQGGGSADWKTFKGDGFSLSVPAGFDMEVNPKLTNSTGQKDKGWSSDVTTKATVISFAVIQTKLSPAAVNAFATNREASWGSILKAHATATEGQTVSQATEVKSASGIEGRQFTRRMGQSQQVVRLYVADGCLYTVMVVQLDVSGGDDRQVEKYLDSFRTE